MARRSIALTFTFLVVAGASALAGPATAQTLPSQTVNVPAGPRDRPVVKFGTHDVGAAPVVQPIVLLNSSAEMIALEPPVVQNPMAIFQKRVDLFALDGQTCSTASLGPGQSCTVYLRLTPSLSQGPSRSPRRPVDYSTLIVTPVGKQATRVRLEADIRHPPVLVPTPATPLRLGRVRPGSRSPGTGVALQMVGSYDITAGRVTVAGADADQFAVYDDRCSGVFFKPFARCSYEVAFVPTSPGPKSAELTIVGAGSSPPRSNLAVYGTGLPTVATALRTLARRSGYRIAGSRLVRLLTRKRFSLGFHAWPAAGTVRASVAVVEPGGGIRVLARSRSMRVSPDGAEPLVIWVRPGARRALVGHGPRRKAIVKLRFTGADRGVVNGERRLWVSGRLPQQR
jgi:hypothetical protein